MIFTVRNSAKVNNSGSMATFSVLLSEEGAICFSLIASDVAISFVPNREIRSIVAITPREAPPVSVTIVVTVVVVTVEIMADNQTLFRRQGVYKVYGRQHQEQKNIR
jgi:hypothetical protein